MASLIPFPSSHHPPCPTWLTGCFSRTLCLSVIYDSGFQHYTPSLTDWNPDSSRYIPICETLSVHLQCNWWAILGRENYIPCVLDISIPCWPLFFRHPVPKTPDWGHWGHHMSIRSSNPREAHHFCWWWLCGDVGCRHWPWCPFAYAEWGIQTKCAKAYPASGFCCCWATRYFCAN